MQVVAVLSAMKDSDVINNNTKHVLIVRKFKGIFMIIKIKVETFVLLEHYSFNLIVSKDAYLEIVHLQLEIFLYCIR